VDSEGSDAKIESGVGRSGEKGGGERRGEDEIRGDERPKQELNQVAVTRKRN
jgi:hypothetical protein